MTPDSVEKMPAFLSMSSVLNWLRGLRGRLRGRRARRSSAAFTRAFVSLAAKTAKADGVAVETEWHAFERFLEVPAHERDNVRRVYDLAKRESAGAEEYARRIGAMLSAEPGAKRDVLECLLYIACADGVLHPEEDQLLSRISAALGYSAAEFRHIRALFVRDAESPYEILGVSHDATDAEVKARYRALASETHPDRLMAAGAPAAVIKAATAKLATINAAYDAIFEERRSGAAR
jgi:DnaJ like chaperone protein